MIPYGKQTVSQADIDSVIAVLKSNYLTQGPCVPKFEHAVSTYCGVEMAVAVTSATAALHITLLALDVGVGDQVWTSPVSFVASSNCALYTGADISFVDISIGTYNIDMDLLEKKLEVAKKCGELPKVIIPVHLSGRPCDLKKLFELKKIYGFHIVEDASHAIGATYKGSKIGSCQYSDACIFSFHPVKIITTGEGGIVTTNSKELGERLAMLRSHGITRDPKKLSQYDGDWYYEQQELGYNYRMTDIQAALGISQLQRIEKFIQKRVSVAAQYRDILKSKGVILPISDDDTYQSSWHLFIVRIPSSNRQSRKSLFDYMRSNGVQVNIHYIPIYRQPYYKNKYNYDPQNFPASENYYSTAMSLPIYPTLNLKDQTFVCDLFDQAPGFQTLF